jgi:hypothetical protein
MIYLTLNTTTLQLIIENKPAPYVYKGTYNIPGPDYGKFYIGSRWGNTTSKNPNKRKLAKDDLGIKYFSSSKHVKDLGFKNFTWEILGEFETSFEAYETEQQLIKINIDNPLILNQHYIDVNNGKQHFRAPETLSENTKQKMRKPKSKEHIKHIAEYQQNRTEEHKANNAEATRHQLKERSVEERKKHAKKAANTRKENGYIVSEETKSKKSTKMKKKFAEEGDWVPKKERMATGRKNSVRYKGKTIKWSKEAIDKRAKTQSEQRKGKLPSGLKFDKEATKTRMHGILKSEMLKIKQVFPTAPLTETIIKLAKKDKIISKYSRLSTKSIIKWFETSDINIVYSIIDIRE